MFELLFDRVYVFAVTQVTAFMAHEHSALGVGQGLLLVGLLWWTWSAYTWLGNQARADEGLLQAGMALATVAIFVVGLALPETFDDVPGGLYGPMVVVVAYLVVRVIPCRCMSSPQLPTTFGYVIRWRSPGSRCWRAWCRWSSGHWSGAPPRPVLFAVALAGEWLSVYLTSRTIVAGPECESLDRAIRAVRDHRHR